MQEATESLNILLAILSETSAILDPLPASSRSPALVAAREMCERIARQTSGIVDTANKKMLEDKHKKIATLKAALKKKDFVSLLEKTQKGTDHTSDRCYVHDCLPGIAHQHCYCTDWIHCPDHTERS